MSQRKRDGRLNFRITETGRRLKSGKDHKSSKSSKLSSSWKSEKYVQGYKYYEDTQFSNSYDVPKPPASSPTYRMRPPEKSAHYYTKPTHQPVSYYNPYELDKYDSYSDMIDYYYIQHKEDSNSIDEPTEPSPVISPAFAPVKRPFVDSPNWSYSEDEETESPLMLPSDLPSFDPLSSQSPTAGQCLVRVGLDQCSSLLETVEPKEDCDCYNFCGGIYLGCCAIDKPCPLSCEIMGGFVAGCVFESTTSNPMDGEFPSLNPSIEPDRSIEPTLPDISTESPAEMPGPSPNNNPSISPPSDVDIISIPLEPFTLEYEITFSRPIAQSDLVVLGSITNSYLQIYMSGAFQSDSVNMADFVTEYSSFVEDPRSSVVLVTFKSTAFFDPSTKELPSRIDLETERASAFQGVALTGYLGRVQALPASNAFSSTSDIFMVQNPASVSPLESRDFSGVAAATAIFTVAILTSFASFSWYRTRRKRRRVEASDNFFRRATGKDYANKEVNIRQNIEDEYRPRRGYKDYPIEIQLTDREARISRGSGGFESKGGTYPYEDDTIDDDEDSSMHRDLKMGSAY